MNISDHLGASFRDPSGFLFTRDGKLFRQVNRTYAADYDRLMSSGLYEKLAKAGRLIPHTETNAAPMQPQLAYKVIEPELLPFISYPYEWSFGMLKEAALTTLSIEKQALKADMSLKDASAYNIQFARGKAVLIDTLSFEAYREGEPWVAYQQFCKHFLSPLALMAYVDTRMSQLLRIYIDGLPLDLVSRLLPLRTRLDFGLMTHLHVHAQAQKKFANREVIQPGPGGGMSKQSLLGLIGSLERSVRKLDWKPAGTEWGNYYNITNYDDHAFELKKQLVAEWTGRLAPKVVWDLGANIGVFSRVAGAGRDLVVAWDIDPAAVEQNYHQVKKAKEQNILPLVLDLTNPSPAMGWHNRERKSLLERGPAELVLALALLHHLAISNNVPLPQLADFFHEMGHWLIIEFISKSDSQVQKLLMNRRDIFDHYSREEFEHAFGQRFKIHEVRQVGDSERSLYLMEGK